MLYLEENVLSWTNALGRATQEATTPPPNSNRTKLQAGDTATLIKDLDVKGAGFFAKCGKAVRNISFTDNPEHIEGRVNGVLIILLSRFLKRSN